MQLSVFEILQDVNYKDKRVMMGMSGGINSAAALVYLAEYVEEKPDELFLYYAHFEEHSSDTEKFVLACVEYAKKKFKKVVFEQSNNSLLDFFKKSKMIPQPKVTPCTRILKIEPMVEFMQKHEIDVDIVGYVRHEWRRMNRQIERGVEKKEYLIRHMSDEDCFSIVEKFIGWFPEIYSLKWNDSRILSFLELHKSDLVENQYNIIKQYAEKGFNFRSNSNRVFKHNNCLPCKNMHQWEIFLLRIFFSSYYEDAMKLAENLGSYWGRSHQHVNESSDCAVCSV